MDDTPYSKVSGTCLIPDLMSSIQSFCPLAKSSVKFPVFRIFDSGTLDPDVGITVAVGAMVRMNAVSWLSFASRLASGMRSILLRTTTLANSSWSTKSAAMSRSSSVSFALASIAATVSMRPMYSSKVLASTTVTQLSSAQMDCSTPASVSTKKVSATCIGSAIPLLSMSTQSYLPDDESSSSWSSRSPRNVQQMHPLAISTS
mmetsp:Transcript_16243/g.50424  ORF Transcript_16243/g.50424 Transcript_16243/m.50424 type:complete len:203 (+) Transcript_16243:1038-1646(+)